MFCKLHQKLYFIYEYEEHLKTHKKCQMCDNEFKSKEALKIHIMKIHLNMKLKNKNKNNNKFDCQILNQDINKNEIICKKCYKEFASVEGLNSHFYYVHKKNNKFNNEIESKEIEIIMDYKNREKLKWQEDLKKKEVEDLKKLEELRKLEELKKVFELKKQEELKKLEGLKKQVELKK